MISSLKWFETGFLALFAANLLVPGVPLCAAQAPPQPPQLAGIAHAAIRVADLNKSREFYVKLGFQEAFAMTQNGTTTQSFLKINDRQFIELYPQRKPTQAIGFMHLCFESGDINALNSYYAASGLSPIPVRRAAAGNLLFTMEGPEKQNIEYTQYMPGSKHSNDKGLHLDANRISEEMVALGIEMQDPVAARIFYTEKMEFAPGTGYQKGQIWLKLPGSSKQQVEIIQHASGTAFEYYFSVASLRRTAAQLKTLQIPFEKRGAMLSIHDPDGNRILFVKALSN